jgi:hypothetical protein
MLSQHFTLVPSMVFGLDVAAVADMHHRICMAGQADGAPARDPGPVSADA